MSNSGIGMTRALGMCGSTPRKRFTAFVVFLCAAIITIVIFISASGSGSEPAEPEHVSREEELEIQLADMQVHIDFLESLYRTKQEDAMILQTFLNSRGNTTSPFNFTSVSNQQMLPTVSPEVENLLKNLTGTRAASGLDTNNLQFLRSPFIFHFLPHLMADPFSLRPAYNMKSNREPAEVVIGIPTVKRDKENYLLITLKHLVNNLNEADANSTLIIVFVGETDLEYVINTARQIEIQFTKQVDIGLIEVLSPSPSYYPDFDKLPATLGDSTKRFKWRTKQNLDTLYLMSYAHGKGTFYLMLEDDVIAKNNYMQEIKQFTSSMTLSVPNWFCLEFCHTGGIGKLFRSSDLVHFTTYVQLFYVNMPIDWLLESYLADRVCTIDKTSTPCSKNKLLIRPKYKTSLFQHIGLFSSLKGKIQKVKDPKYRTAPKFYSHKNPRLEAIRSTLTARADHTIQKAYDGVSFFWAEKPKKGDTIEFLFEKPTVISQFTFRSANIEHETDKFYNTVVEVLPASNYANYTVVGNFDEFGLAEGDIKKDIGPLSAIRLRVHRNSSYWVILSEIELLENDGEKPA